MSSSSELSELTSNVSSDIEDDTPAAKKSTLDHYFKNTPKSAQPPKLKKKRPPSPPHQYVLADREEVAVGPHDFLDSNAREFASH